MKCPDCGGDTLRNFNTRNMRDGKVYRQKECQNCGKKVVTIEVYVPENEHPCPKMFRRTAVIEWRGTDAMAGEKYE